MKKNRINFIYLAAGYARRFGSEKLLAKFHGKPLFEHGLLEGLKLKKLLESCNADDTDQLIDTAKIELRILVVTSSADIERFCHEHEVSCTLNYGESNTGIASSIQKGIREVMTCQHAKAHQDFIDKKNIKDIREYDMFVQADQPYLDAVIMNSFLRAFLASGKEIGSLCYKNHLRSPNIFAESCRGILLELEGDMGGKRIIQQNPELVFSYPVTDGKIFIDIDTMEDYHNENV